MTISVDELEQQVLSLSAADRARLIQTVLSSTRRIDSSVDSAWTEEIEARMSRYKAGDVELHDSNDVMASIKKRLG